MEGAPPLRKARRFLREALLWEDALLWEGGSLVEGGLPCVR